VIDQRHPAGNPQLIYQVLEPLVDGDRPPAWVKELSPRG
jgi:hypothetical protein